MNLSYRILFHLARAMAVDPGVRVVSDPAGDDLDVGGREAHIERDVAHARSLLGHDPVGSALQSLGRPRHDAAPVRGPRRRPQAG